MTDKEKIEEIDSFDFFQKQIIYSHYISVQLGLKYTVFLQHGIYIETFDDFVKESNIRVIDHGRDWNENGFAQRYLYRFFGIYDWYWKFKEVIKINNL